MVSAWAKRWNEDPLDHVHRLLKEGLRHDVVEFWTEMPIESVRHVAKVNKYKEDPKRLEFSDRVKDLADARCNGRCEKCGDNLEAREYDHITECFYGGSNTLHNCAVLCPPCHKAKTKRRAGDMAKSRRLRGIPKSKKKKRRIASQPMIGTKKSGYTKPMNGNAYRRSEK